MGLGMKRREFLKVAGAASAAVVSQGAMAQNGRSTIIVVDGSDPVAGTPAVRWAAEQLRSAMAAKGRLCRIVTPAERVRGAALYVVVAGSGSALAKGFQGASRELNGAEILRLTPGRHAGVAAVLVSGSDVRGTVYGLLELAERVRFGGNPAIALHLTKAIEERPANEIRTVSRYFCSELEDKPWLYDKDLWTGYLDLLVASRFNRFCLAFGLEYDFPRDVTDDYLHLPYPYLVDVPGYDVRVMQLVAPDGTKLAEPRAVSEEEKKKNYDALKFIASQTAVRGLHFQLGIWTHAYQWTDSPNAYHNIEGLTPDTHAAYCRDALAMILKDCPEIQGLTLRVHGESGIPEGSYDFWRTVFEAIKGCGRTVEIDMHAKGVDQKIIDIAVATGMPVKLGAKYSSEHQSLGYQQADIRELEIPRPGHEGGGPFSLSNGARSFTRYGYADFLQTGSKYKVVFRLWPGTQRHLLSADPEMAAAYGRTSHFCGAVGMDLMEPLTFKGREGSGQPGGRCAYADATLNPKYDWQKSELYYRVWGRKLYDPDADPEAWRRWLRSECGAGAIAMETAVANASRILALLTSAHLPSASNHTFWPEIYTNMPIVIGSERSPYGDTPTPRCFGTVSPLDPQTFSTIEEHASDMMSGSANAKYSPIEVAQWMEDFAAAASSAIAQARQKSAAHSSPAFRRMEADVLIQIGLGRFFAGKMRSGVLYSILGQSEVRDAGLQAMDQYKLAREAWSAMASHAATIYRSDVSYGRIPMRRGDWSDRLAAIDKDIEAMSGQVRGSAASDAMSTPNTRRAIQEATGRPTRPSIECVHTPPATFQPGEALTLSLSVPQENVDPMLASVLLHYRHVNQGERWKQIEMQASGDRFTATVPAEYTQSPYAMQYSFELRTKSGQASLVPAFNATLSNQPYYSVMQRTA
jgi:hypothetical protein